MLLERQRHILADGQAIEQRGELKREADLLPQLIELLFGHMAEVVTEKVDVAGVGRDQTVEQTQDRRLACAGEADDAGDRTLDDVEAAVAQHDAFAEGEVDVVHAGE